MPLDSKPCPAVFDAGSRLQAGSRVQRFTAATREGLGQRRQGMNSSFHTLQVGAVPGQAGGPLHAWLCSLWEGWLPTSAEACVCMCGLQAVRRLLFSI